MVLVIESITWRRCDWGLLLPNGLEDHFKRSRERVGMWLSDRNVCGECSRPWVRALILLHPGKDKSPYQIQLHLWLENCLASQKKKRKDFCSSIQHNYRSLITNMLKRPGISFSYEEQGKIVCSPYSCSAS